MYLKNLQIRNIGPIEKLDYKLPFFDNGNPKPVIFVGENGSGKSILLSYIVDSFFQFKIEHYEDIEIKKEKLFKFQSNSYISLYKDFGWLDLEYTHKTDSLFYTEVLSRIQYDKFIEKYQSEKIPNFNKDDNRFKEYGLFHKHTNGNKSKKAIDESVMLYFPDNRFEIPAWLNEQAFTKREFEGKMRLITESRRLIIMMDTMRGLEGWILDVVLDSALYKELITSILLNEIHRIIQATLTSKWPDKENIRFGVKSRKTGNRIAIFNDIYDEQGKRKTEELIPTLYHLSSGEASLLVLFASILRDYDIIAHPLDFILENIEGIVVIDEIDSHLHIDLQRETLPKMIKLFPKIQFIVTTHSPVLLSGMKEVFDNNLDIIDLPGGDSIDPESFSEFVKALKIFYEEGIKFEEELNKMKAKIKEITSPLIITEGKTDWKHLKKGKEKLNIVKDIFFYENEKDMGDAELSKLCESHSRLSNDKPLIFIFDRDNPSPLKKVTDSGKDFKAWGNNVFSFAIPVPSHREGYENISIEFYYTDDEIKTSDLAGRRLFFSSEFKERSGQHRTDKNLKFGNANKLRGITDKTKAKIIDSEVFNENEENVALSKGDFADNIHKDISPFNNFRFDEFKKVFNIIESILNTPQ